MVEVKVVRAFCDKDTSNFVSPGDILSKPQKRADELMEGGFVEHPIKAKDEPAKPKTEPAPENKAKTITTDNIAKAEPAKSKPSTKEEKKFD